MSSVAPAVADGSGFTYLKRDLVRLLGVLAHGVKDVQDRTREAGGLPVIMNLCVIDERNPCMWALFFLFVHPFTDYGFNVLDLREHAIFTLHNLLKNNPENQRFVDSVKPSQEWAEDGTLKTKVGATLK
jgi:ataxin-10